MEIMLNSKSLLSCGTKHKECVLLIHKFGMCSVVTVVFSTCISIVLLRGQGYLQPTKKYTAYSILYEMQYLLGYE